MARNLTDKVDLTNSGLLKFDPAAAEILWDRTLRGFGLRTRKSTDSSRWVWIVAFREGKGRGTAQVKLTRPFRDATPYEARRWADDERRLRGTADSERAKHRANRERRAEEKARLEEEKSRPTVGQLWDEYWAVEGRFKKAGRGYRQLWTTHLLPRFARLKVRDVSPSEVDGFKEVMFATPGACNRALALLSRMMSVAIRKGYRAGCAPEHPVKGVTRYPEHPSNFYFTEDELGRILEAADTDPNKAGGLAIRMLALTGARVGEVLGAHWGQFEFRGDKGTDGAWWAIEASSTKGGRAITRYLSPDLAGRLWSQMETSFRTQKGGRVVAMAQGRRLWWVFPNVNNPDEPTRRLWHVWERVLARAGVRPGRLHDLRHTAATLAYREKRSLLAVQAQLGHASIQTTRLYAHLFPDAVEEMGSTLDRIGAEAQARARAGNGPVWGVVVPLEAAEPARRL